MSELNRKSLLQRGSLLISFLFLASFLSLFQNCGPALRTGEEELATKLELPIGSPTPSPEPSPAPEPSPSPSPSPQPGPITSPSCDPGYHLEGGICIGNIRSCELSTGQGSQSWINGAWSTCNATQCYAGFHLENGQCINDHKVCSLNGKYGSQGWSSTIGWSACAVCPGGKTSFMGVCLDNHFVVRQYASYLPHCWSEGTTHCPGLIMDAHIGTPNRYSASSGETISYKVLFANAHEILLTSSLVELLPSSGVTGCQKSVLTTGTSERQINITGCQGNGKISIRILAGSAKHISGYTQPAVPESTAVIITNSSSLPNVNYITHTDKTYPGANGANISYELYYPSDYQTKTNIPVIIWIHGGGWAGGSHTEDAVYAKAFASLGYIVINAEYTKATGDWDSYPNIIPMNPPYNLGMEDIQALVTFVKNNLAVINGDSNRISIAGASAGGHLALFQATRSNNPVTFKCVIDFAGPTDLALARSYTLFPVSSFLVGSVFGNEPTYLRSKSPNYQVSTLKANKVLIMHQLQDNLVPIDQAIQFAKSVKSLKPGVELILNYADETNPYPIYNPSQSQITHLYSNEQQKLGAMKAFVHSHCR